MGRLLMSERWGEWRRLENRRMQLAAWPADTAEGDCATPYQRLRMLCKRKGRYMCVTPASYVPTGHWRAFQPRWAADITALARRLP